MARLFEKTTIKGMELKNRLVRSATHEGMSDENGFPQKPLFALYERLAKGGVGLIITGYAFVSRDGNSLFRGMHGIPGENPRRKPRAVAVHALQSLHRVPDEAVTSMLSRKKDSKQRMTNNDMTMSKDGFTTLKFGEAV